jgi:3-oxoadipate enol-lactonase
MAQDVLAVLDHAGIQQASVLGTSLGGMMAQELALAHPERVDRLVLVATVPGGLRSRPMPLGTTYLFAVSPSLTDKASLRQFVNNALGPSTLRRRPKIARRLAATKLAHPHSEPAWRAQVAAGMLFNPLGRQRDLTQPTLVMQGTADQVVDPATPTSWSYWTESDICSIGSSPGGSRAWSPASSTSRQPPPAG